MAENNEQDGVNHIAVDDVEVEEVWKRLKQDPESVLIDVRTQAEWAYVGVPDLSSLGKQLSLIEWQHIPKDEVNSSFASQLGSELAASGAGQDRTRIYTSSAVRGTGVSSQRRRWRRRDTVRVTMLLADLKVRSTMRRTGGPSQAGKLPDFLGFSVRRI